MNAIKEFLRGFWFAQVLRWGWLAEEAKRLLGFGFMGFWDRVGAWFQEYREWGREDRLRITHKKGRR